MWVRLDDGVSSHPKLLDAGADASWLWVCGLAHCNRAATNGTIAKRHVTALYEPLASRATKLAARLVEVGLWLDQGDHYAVHDYAQYQEEALKESRDERREAARMRKRAERERKKQAKIAESHAVTPRDKSHVTGRDIERDVPRDITCDQPRDMPRDAAPDTPEVRLAPSASLFDGSPPLESSDFSGPAAADAGVSQAPVPARPDPARPDPSLAALAPDRDGRVGPVRSRGPVNPRVVPELGLMPEKPPKPEQEEGRDLRFVVDAFEDAMEKHTGHRLGLTLAAQWERATAVFRWAKKTRPEDPHSLVLEAVDCACASESLRKLGNPWAAFASAPGRNLRGSVRKVEPLVPTSDEDFEKQLARFGGAS